MLDLVMGIVGFAMVLPFGIPILIFILCVPYLMVKAMLSALMGEREELPPENNSKYPMKVVVPRW